MIFGVKVIMDKQNSDSTKINLNQYVDPWYLHELTETQKAKYFSRFPQLIFSQKKLIEEENKSLEDEQEDI